MVTIKGSKPAAKATARKRTASQGTAVVSRKGGGDGHSFFNHAARSALEQGIVFDIETAPAFPEDLWSVIDPFDESTFFHPSDLEFDPQSVKTGNLKDAAKIQAKIDEAYNAHMEARENRPQLLAEAKLKYEQSVLEDAALHAETCRVLVVGYLDVKEDRFFATSDNLLINEADVIRNFWDIHREASCLCGLNIFRFDLPVLIRRSWILGVPVPRDVRDELDRYWNTKYLDLAARWQCGNRQEYISLDRLARAMGVGRKNGDGKDFHKLWNSDRQAAYVYLENDLRLPLECARKMQYAA